MDVLIAGLLGGIVIIVMFCAMGLPADIVALDDAQQAQARQPTPRAYVYDGDDAFVDGEYTIDDVPVALLEVRHGS